MSNLFSLLSASRASKWMATTDLRGEATRHSQDLIVYFFFHREKSFQVFLFMLLLWRSWTVCFAGFCGCIISFAMRFLKSAFTYSNHTRCHSSSPPLKPSSWTVVVHCSWTLSSYPSLTAFLHAIYHAAVILSFVFQLNTLAALSVITFRFHLKEHKV